MRRGALAVAALTAACSWELPPPHVARDAGARDAADARPVDAPPRDVPAVDVGFDAPSADAPADVTDVTDVTDARDAADATDARDAPDVRDAAVDAAACALGEFRACESDASVPTRGYCRPGVQFCEAGAWTTACEGEVRPDCADRACGPDGCGGSCGACPSGRGCDDTGRCVTTACGAANFTVTCPRGRCPANAGCGADGQCMCSPGFEARHCDGARCAGDCAFPDWWCAPAPFCAGGSTLCRGGFLCPRWSLCDEVNRACLCRPGFTARRCDGTLCASCLGTEYECTPMR